ncbi:acetyl-CoA synthetase-like protein [Zopfia rhizophila CBS 207.26]|uniref:Acetyl-CoA synthetase-like protein n=1 Tax=Zopfia rhizophila CBS 207.26 TaxID=1314779 RepID=A0A6A6EIA9_9PEZI|nr:acetyl-CoA synthetase-like protein [Zopfia rhizophila CBS 207.26]
MARSLSSIIEKKAEWLPEHTFVRYPGPDWETNGYRTITWRQYADAINKAAYWLDGQLGKSTDNDTIAYIGPPDPRYSIILPAAIKTNRKLLIPDGRVTKEGVKSLINETKCTVWLDPHENDSLTQELGIQDTGLPKPIYHTNGYYSTMASFNLSSRIHWTRGVAPCPPQWLGGLVAYIFFPVFLNTSSILPTNVSGLPPALFKKILQRNPVDGICCPPHTIHQLYNDIETHPLLKSLQCIIYLGAALDQNIGDDLWEHTKLTSIIGSTENGPQLDLLPTDKRLWHTHDYVPENGYHMVHIPNSGPKQDGSGDFYELVLERQSDVNGDPSIYQCAFWNPMYNGLNTIETKELYAPVKDIDGRTRWVFSARKDDLTKLSWLAKFHAQDIEIRIKKHPDILNVFVGGEGRPAPFVIVEPKESVLDTKGAEALLDELYESVVAQANKADIKEIRIPKETVLVAKREKAFKMSGKQTFLRKEIEKDYMEEIEAAYERL